MDYHSSPTIDVRLAQLGLPVPAGYDASEAAQLVRPVLARQRELSRRLAERYCATDQRIQDFLDAYLADVCPEGAAPLPRRTFVLDSPDRPNEKEQVTLTVLQKVTVIATGRETTRSLSRASADRSGSYSTVTLLVTPREAETLIACEQNRGRLTLALRNPDDLGYEDELPTVDFKYIRQTLNALNKTRQDTINRRTPAPLLGR